MYKLSSVIVFFVLSAFNGLTLAAGPLSDLTITPAAQRKTAPAFVLENLTGKKSTLADYKGKLLLVNFWATWCIPCRQEMPSMEALWQKYKEQGLVVIAISLDEDAKSRVESFKKIFKLSFPILLDPQAIASDAYKVSGVPASYLIDRKGNIIARIVGSDDWASAEALQLIKTLLAD